MKNTSPSNELTVQSDTPLSVQQEEWRAVPGFEGYYDVSNMGRLRSYRHGRNIRKIPKSKIAVMRADGYWGTYLQAHPKKKNYKICTLVLLAFVGPRPADKEAAHLNGLATDDRLDNLAWKTHTENMADTLTHNTRAFGERCGRSKLSLHDAGVVLSLFNLGLPRRLIGQRFGVSEFQIINIGKRRDWPELNNY